MPARAKSSILVAPGYAATAEIEVWLLLVKWLCRNVDISELRPSDSFLPNDFVHSRGRDVRNETVPI